MKRLQKVRTVAFFEFLTTVKRPGYLIATFGMPLFVTAYGAIAAIPAYYAEMKDRAPAVYGVIDRAGALALAGDVKAPLTQVPDEVKKAIESAGPGQTRALEEALGRSNFVFRPFGEEAQARIALRDELLKGYFVLPADYFANGVVEVYSPDTAGLSGSDARSAFANLVRERLVSGRLESGVGARVVSPLKDAKRFTILRTGEVADGSRAASAVRIAVPLAFTILFLMSVLMTSGYLMQGTATEKENKVVEVLLASANPDEILAGKLVGLGGAGLLQIAVWLVMVLVAGFGIVPLLVATEVSIPWLALALAVPMFLIAFLFFGSLMLGTGSLGSNIREAQQLAMVWSLTAALPLIMLSVLLREPHGTAAKVMTWVPFTAGPVTVMRASMDAGALAWWEIATAFAVLIVSTKLALGLGARLFRIGLLSAGSRPSLREILRQARLA